MNKTNQMDIVATIITESYVNHYNGLDISGIALNEGVSEMLDGNHIALLEEAIDDLKDLPTVEEFDKSPTVENVKKTSVVLSKLAKNIEKYSVHGKCQILKGLIAITTNRVLAVLTVKGLGILGVKYLNPLIAQILAISLSMISFMGVQKANRKISTTMKQKDIAMTDKDAKSLLKTYDKSIARFNAAINRGALRKAVFGPNYAEEKYLKDLIKQYTERRNAIASKLNGSGSAVNESYEFDNDLCDLTIL